MLTLRFNLNTNLRFPKNSADRTQNLMKKKLLAAQQANAARVILADSRLESPINAALNGGGTHIVRDAAWHGVSAPKEVAYAE